MQYNCVFLYSKQLFFWLLEIYVNCFFYALFLNDKTFSRTKFPPKLFLSKKKEQDNKEYE